MGHKTERATSLLERTPTALFPIALGLAGLSANFSIASEVHNTNWLLAISNIVLLAAAVSLAVNVTLYSTKAVRARQNVVDDFAVATRANLLAPGFMAAMVIGGLVSRFSTLGGLIWMLAAIGHLLLLLRFVGRWLTREFAPEDLNPTWFLPAAGIMTGALTWPGYGPVQLPAFTLAAGATLWLLLIPLVFRRVVFEPVLDPKLRPTLFIIAAPFGLLAGGLLTLLPQISFVIPTTLVCGGLFFLLVLVMQPRFLMAAGITLSWWATTFPITVVSSGFLRLSNQSRDIFEIVGTCLLGLAVCTTGLAIIASAQALSRIFTTTFSENGAEIAAMHGLPEMPEKL